jgi:hypothetical protein
MYYFLVYCLSSLLALEIGWLIGRRFAARAPVGGAMDAGRRDDRPPVSWPTQVAVSLVLDPKFQAEMTTALRQIGALSQTWGEILRDSPERRNRDAAGGAIGNSGATTSDVDVFAAAPPGTAQSITIVDRMSIGSSSSTSSVGKISGFLERDNADSFRIREILLSGEFWRDDFLESMARLGVREAVESQIQGARQEDRCRVSFSCVFTPGTEPRMQLPVARKVLEWSVDLIPHDTRARKIHVERDLAAKPIFIAVRLE